MPASSSGEQLAVVQKKPAGADTESQQASVLGQEDPDQDKLDYRKSEWLKKQKDLGNLTVDHLLLIFH